MLLERGISDIARLIEATTDIDGLRTALPTISASIGFDYYAISRHAGLSRHDDDAPIHNYPDGWSARYINERLGRCDPVHRACHVRSSGFRWRDAQSIVPFSSRDNEMLIEARRFGIEDGFSIPANLFGAARGSVTFAIRPGTPFPEDHLLDAQALGSILFQKVLDIGWGRHLPRQDILTERQLECVMWVGRGKCNWAIARVLGLSVNTVKKHLREASERYESATRATLPLNALRDGSLCITDVFPD